MRFMPEEAGFFDSQELNDYFYSKPWYYGRILPEDFSSDVFNKYELANITLLDGYERAFDPNGYQPHQIRREAKLSGKSLAAGFFYDSP